MVESLEFGENLIGWYRKKFLIPSTTESFDDRQICYIRTSFLIDDEMERNVTFKWKRPNESNTGKT